MSGNCKVYSTIVLKPSSILKLGHLGLPLWAGRWGNASTWNIKYNWNTTMFTCK